MAEMTVEDLQDLLWTFAQHRVVTVAGRVGILRRLAESATTPDRVADDLKLDPYATGKLIRSLHAMGLLTADGDTYSVVGGLAPHFTAGPNDITPFFEHSHDMYDGWGRNLEPWLHGEPWQSGARDPESARRFGAAMRAIGAEIARRTASAIDTTGVSSMLDVGGGFGQYSIALCVRKPSTSRHGARHPGRHPPWPRSNSRGRPSRSRISFLGGDYLTTDYGNGYDLVLIANVLHQERPPPGGRDGSAFGRSARPGRSARGCGLPDRRAATREPLRHSFCYQHALLRRHLHRVHDPLMDERRRLDRPHPNRSQPPQMAHRRCEAGRALIHRCGAGFWPAFVRSIKPKMQPRRPHHNSRAFGSVRRFPRANLPGAYGRDRNPSSIMDFSSFVAPISPRRSPREPP